MSARAWATSCTCTTGSALDALIAAARASNSRTAPVSSGCFLMAWSCGSCSKATARAGRCIPTWSAWLSLCADPRSSLFRWSVGSPCRTTPGPTGPAPLACRWQASLHRPWPLQTGCVVRLGWSWQSLSVSMRLRYSGPGLVAKDVLRVHLEVALREVVGNH